MKPNETSNAGPLIGSIIIVLILIVGGYYSLASRPAEPEEPVTPPAPSEETEVTLPVSTEIEDLSADVGSIDVGSADADLENVENAVN